MATIHRSGTFRYKTEGTCCAAISFRVVAGKLRDVRFDGGCHGNTQGVARLVEGCALMDVHKRLKGIRCGDKRTSCPDQLACAIEAWRQGRAPTKRKQ
jgi:uncharacterized protein (TIGR03905 family)